MTEIQEPRDRYEEAVTLLEKTRRELEAKIDEVEQIKTALHIAKGWYELIKVQIPATAHDLQSNIDGVKARTHEIPNELRSYIDDLFIGSVAAFAMHTPPSGWLMCNGDTVNRKTYWKLFQRVGTTFGKGDDSTTFNLPDMRGLFIRGHDSRGNHDPQRKFGSYQEDQIQSHSHTDSGHNHSGNIHSEGNHSHGASTDLAGAHNHSGRTSSDGSHSHYLNKYNDGDYFNALGFRKNRQNHHDPAYCGKILAGFKGGMSFLGRTLSLDGYPDDITSCDSAGSHSHTLSINSADSHSHSVNVNSAGSHSHSIEINNGIAKLGNPVNAQHGSETRVKNIALIYCIKF